MIRTMEDILSAARAQKQQTMSVAVAQDVGVLEAVCDAAKLGLIHPILVGDQKEMERIAKERGLSLSGMEILPESDKESACIKAASLGRDGIAGLVMKGFVDTAYILRAILSRENNLRKTRLLSHVLLLEVPGFNRLFCVTDSAMNIAPTLEEKKIIIENAVDVIHALGNPQPKVAALCAVEKVNSKMPCTVDAAELAAMNRRGELTGCLVAGPLALDNAVSSDAASHKGVAGPVAGNADILLTPDIEAGNLLNKAMEYFGHAKKAGLIMGAKIPIVLTSRATAPQSKLYSIALGALIAGRE